MSETRYFSRRQDGPCVPEPGELVLVNDETGLRHYLDGRPIECGTSIRILDPTAARKGQKGAGRLLVRYEMSLEPRPVRATGDPESTTCAVIYFSSGEERVARREDRFEWIPRT